MAKISDLSTKIDSHLAGNRQRIETLTSSHMSVNPSSRHTHTKKNLTNQ
jgi:hypothetical protein